MKVYVKNGQVQRVAVDTNAPVNPGAFCVRPTLARAYQQHPFRLKFPLKRAGARGANQWQQISWAQALDEISEKLRVIRRKYGAEALATSSGTGRGAAEFAKTRFMNLFGSPNRMGIITICYAPRAMVWFTTFGGHLVADRKPGKTKLLVHWGTQRARRRPRFLEQLSKGQKGRYQNHGNRPAFYGAVPSGRPLGPDPARHRCRPRLGNDTCHHRRRAVPHGFRANLYQRL